MDSPHGDKTIPLTAEPGKCTDGGANGGPPSTYTVIRVFHEADRLRIIASNQRRGLDAPIPIAWMNMIFTCDQDKIGHRHHIRRGGDTHECKMQFRL